MMELSQLRRGILYTDCMERLAELVKNNPNYQQGMAIKLLSCNLGGKTSGYDNYAQRFANAIG